MWHASIMGPNAEALARQALEGVGDASLGEWIEPGRAFHIRRRFSVREAIESGLAVRDLRGTDEGRQRLRRLFQQFPQLKPFAIAIGEWA